MYQINMMLSQCVQTSLCPPPPRCALHVYMIRIVAVQSPRNFQSFAKCFSVDRAEPTAVMFTRSVSSSSAIFVQTAGLLNLQSGGGKCQRTARGKQSRERVQAPPVCCCVMFVLRRDDVQPLPVGRLSSDHFHILPARTG